MKRRWQHRLVEAAWPGDHRLSTKQAKLFQLLGQDGPVSMTTLILLMDSDQGRIASMMRHLIKRGIKIVALGSRGNRRYWLGSKYDGYLEARPDAAVKICRQELRREANDPDTLYRLGNANYRREDFKEAARAFQQVIRLDKDHANAIYMLGASYQALGWVAEARQQMEKLRERDLVLCKERETILDQNQP